MMKPDEAIPRGRHASIRYVQKIFLFLCLNGNVCKTADHSLTAK
jgi:hypothetical protein